MVLALDETANSIQSPELLGKLGVEMPDGIRLIGAKPLSGRTLPRPVRMTYQMQIPGQRREALLRRLDELGRCESWPVQRPVRNPKRRDAPRARRIDLKPLIDDLSISGPCGELLRWSVSMKERASARCNEVLRLLGLDERADLARVVRIAVEYRDNSVY